MKSKDLQELVLLKTRNGLSSLQINKELCDLVSRRTIQSWQAMYRKIGKIQLKKPPGGVRKVRTKNVIQKVKNVTNVIHGKVYLECLAN
jgi:transposase